MSKSRVPLTQEPFRGTEFAEQYDRYAAFFMRPEYRLTAKNIGRYGITGGLVLDVGTGTGRLALELTRSPQLSFKVIGLDISFDMLQRGRVLAGKMERLNRTDFVQATGASLPFPNNTFDVVTSYASLHHWQDPVRVFNEIWRVTRNSGLILIRDNRRVVGIPIYDAARKVISLFMPEARRQLWPKALMASYTLPEIRQILDQTDMRLAQVRADMAGFDLCISLIKNQAGK
ncbi:MAG TPA: class I SAM-dependent methyltransferase [Dehalococcoidales bacterium]|nr:class I SAM-dependent methyltransferase [Dehalococcoidales bacterium]